MPEYSTGGGLTLVEGLDAVRRRPEIYVGAENRSAHLLGLVLQGLARDTPTPSEIRVYVWRDAVTIAIDGKPLPIEPFSKGTSELPHPALYQFFMYLVGGGEGLGRTLAFGGVLNALSERLVVSTMHGEMRYRVVFARGHVVMLLSRNRFPSPLGTTWLTYRRDQELMPGEPLTHTDVAAIAAKTTSVRINVYNRSTEEPDWY